MQNVAILRSEACSCSRQNLPLIMINHDARPVAWPSTLVHVSLWQFFGCASSLCISVWGASWLCPKVPLRAGRAGKFPWLTKSEQQFNFTDGRLAWRSERIYAEARCSTGHRVAGWCCCCLLQLHRTHWMQLHLLRALIGLIVGLIRLKTCKEFVPSLCSLL